MLVKTDINTISGAKIIIEILKQMSVDTIFGYPGGVLLDFYDELYKQNNIKHILVRHEQNAIHALEGYARQSHKCAVAIVTSGPGATNIITGLYNAYLDGYPMVVITGQIEKELLNVKDSFQKADICQIAKSCTKAVYQVTDANNLVQTLISAFKCAQSGKKGPVLIDITKNVFSQKIEFIDEKLERNLDNPTFNESDINRIYDRILNSSSPVIVTGGGIHHAQCYKELEKLIRHFNIPVVSSMMGIGAINTDSSNYFGMIGLFGDNCANEIIKKSDLIISFGCRFNDKITAALNYNDIRKKLIQFDIDRDTIFELHPLDYVLGDLKASLKALLVKSGKKDYDKFKTWTAKAETYKKMNIGNNKISNCLHGFEVINKINDFTKDKNILFTSDVGQHQILAVKNLLLNSNRRIMLSGGFGTMGFGFPASIGACVANTDLCSVCITGDGSFQMSLTELALCKDLGLNIKVVVLNNGYLGMVRQLQENRYNGRYSQTKISSPDFVAIAKGYGLDGIKIQSLSKVEDALQMAFSTNETFILDFQIESMEVV